MKAIRKCGPLTKIFLCIVFASIILAIVHSFTETSVKEALNTVNGWSAERDEQSLTILHNNKPIVSIDKNTGLNLGQLAKKNQFHSHTGNKNIHVPSGTGAQGERGKPGPRGYDGQSGIIGQVGVGQVGRSGQRGPAGPRGETGPTGAIGATGAAGGSSYTYLFDGCPRDGATGGTGTSISGWNMVQGNTTFEKCKQKCDENPKCTAIEINSCGSEAGDKPSTCSTSCYTFYGTGANIKNGYCGGYNRNAKKVYKKN